MLEIFDAEVRLHSRKKRRIRKTVNLRQTKKQMSSLVRVIS
jgi:hypothetical protein